MLEYDRFARFYDAEFADFQDDLPLLRHYAERAGGPLLELGCGSGRVLVPLAQAGFQLTGVDSSGEMLARTRRRVAAARVGNRVTLVDHDIADVALDHTFGMAFIQVNSFMHLNTLQRQRQALRCWHGHLRPGAALLIDLFNPDLLTLIEADGRLLVDQQWHDEATGATIVKQLTRRIDLSTQLQETIFVYDEVFPDGTSHRTLIPFTLRFLWRAEAELLLELCGYRLETVYGGYEMQPYDAESPRMILVARRV